MSFFNDQMNTGVSPSYLSLLIRASEEGSTVYNLRNANNIWHTFTHCPESSLFRFLGYCLRMY